MKSEFNRERPRPVLIPGRVEIRPNRAVLHSLNHQETTLLYQQRVAALIECAREYAHDPSNAHAVRELLRVAAAFTENS